MSGSASAQYDPGDLVLSVAGQQISGWESIRVTRGVERMPSDFELVLSDRYPGQATKVSVQPGQRCQVMLGTSLVVTGYVDRVAPALAPDRHAIQVRGRGLCQDLVDCSVTATDVPGLQITGGTVASLATKMAQPFGVTVQQLSGPAVQLPQFNVNLGETPYDVLERAARWAQLLLYDGADGNLVLAQAGTTAMASGFIEGVNCEAASASFGMDERFSVYIPAIMSVDKTYDLGSGGNYFPAVYDKGVSRYRPRVVICEQFQSGQSLATARANWERSRRYGRSQMVQLTCDSWRDTKGTPWTPNCLVDVDIPSVSVTKARWIIGEVSYLRDATRGTTAEITLMPPEAFQPEPELLQAFDWQVGQDLQAGGLTATGLGAHDN